MLLPFHLVLSQLFLWATTLLVHPILAYLAQAFEGVFGLQEVACDRTSQRLHLHHPALFPALAETVVSQPELSDGSVEAGEGTRSGESIFGCVIIILLVL